MDELRNKPSVDGLKRGTFQVRKMELLAVHVVVEGPKLVTIAMHDNRSEITPIHCQLKNRGVVDFHVPKQRLFLHYSSGGLKFTTTRVFFGKTSFWMIICEETRKGFILPGHVLNAHGNLSHSRRFRPLCVYQ